MEMSSIIPGHFCHIQHHVVSIQHIKQVIGQKCKLCLIQCACCLCACLKIRLTITTRRLSAEKYEPCRNPGAASTSVQSSEQAFYQAGETLTFSCHSGYELQGEATIYCIPGHPSQWNSTPPACRGKQCPHTTANFLVLTAFSVCRYKMWTVNLLLYCCECKDFVLSVLCLVLHNSYFKTAFVSL